MLKTVRYPGANNGSTKDTLTARDMGIKIEWNCSQRWCPGRPVWMSETWTQIELIDVGHY